MFRHGNQKQKGAQKRGTETKKYASPLEELEQCLDRLEDMVEVARAFLHGEDLESPPPTLASTGKKSRFFRASKRDLKDTDQERSRPTLDDLQKLYAGDSKSKFVPSSTAEEEEVIETLRRIAEIVVMGEKSAAAELKKVEKSNDNDERQRARIDAHIALFETFFERNTLDLIVKMVTGVAFREGKNSNERPKKSEVSDITISETSDSLNELSLNKDITFLPTLRIATQAIQSVSILIQNVSRATSLYFLLSNNYVNDLINLPLNEYSAAERFRRGEMSTHVSQLRTASPEMSELTTHYVTFLKSLALRMNAETLQFFLTYPEGDDSASSTNLSTSTKKSSSTNNIKPVHIKAAEVDFPLYARALEYCAAHQDSFVRVTAMNICLNTLRLVTVIPTESDELDFQNNTSSPDGVLFNAQALPLRERLAIAQHVCSPRLVEALVSPIFTKLAQLWGTMEELIRDVDMLREGKLQNEGGTRVRHSKMEKVKAETKKNKLTNLLKNTIANVQDELLLFEDVLKVGLTSLNEQSIEMMLATFVYPLLLQPLLLYFSSLNRAQIPLMVDVLKTGAKTSSSEAGIDSLGIDKIQDSAPAKTALFSLTAVFQVLSNPPLMRLLLTALFHPLAPDSSGETMIRSKPDVAGVGDDGKLCVRLDPFSQNEEKLKFERSPYSFGNITGQKSVKGEDQNEEGNIDESCVYVLSPALTEVLEGTAGDLSLIARTRSNPYRRAVLKCLSAGPSMFGMRQLSALLMDAIVKRFDSKFASDILFGAGMKTSSDDMPIDERNLDSKRAYSKNNRGMGERLQTESRRSIQGGSNSNFMHELISALCMSIINVSTYHEGIWKLVYDGVAAHTLLFLAKEDEKAMELASKMLEQRRRMSAAFISEMPIQLDKITLQDNTEDKEARMGMLIHNILFKSAKGKKYSVVGELLKLKPTLGDTEDDEYSVSIAITSKFDDIAGRLCSFGRLHLDSEIESAVMQLSAIGAMALAQVDALSTFLKDLAATNCATLRGDTPTAFTISRAGTIVSTTMSPGIDVNRSIFSPISNRLSWNLLKLHEEMSKAIPKPGAVVGLVGRTAIPCVCEVPETCSLLLTDETASVVSDGVKWLSLYVVFLSGYMILAEPERKGSGGNGRVVSACYLTSLSVERDLNPPAGNTSPARRLLVVHHSLDEKAPGLFIREKSSTVTFGPFHRLERFKSTLDVWFEDENSAEHAFRVMNVKLSRAITKRGNRIREKFTRDE